jgi:hypothetical protein
VLDISKKEITFRGEDKMTKHEVILTNGKIIKRRWNGKYLTDEICFDTDNGFGKIIPQLGMGERKIANILLKNGSTSFRIISGKIVEFELNGRRFIAMKDSANSFISNTGVTSIDAILKK